MSNTRTSLRTTVRINTDGTETVLGSMGDLRKGDRFRVEVDDEDDHMHGHGHVIWTADEDPTQRDGVWGLQCHADIGNGAQDWNAPEPPGADL